MGSEKQRINPCMYARRSIENGREYRETAPNKSRRNNERRSRGRDTLLCFGPDKETNEPNTNQHSGENGVIAQGSQV